MGKTHPFHLFSFYSSEHKIGGYNCNQTLVGPPRVVSRQVTCHRSVTHQHSLSNDMKSTSLFFFLKKPPITFAIKSVP